MSKHNELIERLAILNEECAEVQKIISKILRHGIESHNPKDPQKMSNRQLLEHELGDLLHAIGFLASSKDVDEEKIASYISTRDISILAYLHQPLPKDNWIEEILNRKKD